jgi:2-C-methyl-D-erythritol 4-phosphate cytidylyltransferase
MNIVLITAGGKGERTKQEIPKQFLHIENKPLLIYTLEAFEYHNSIDAILVSCLEGWHEILWAYARQFGIHKLRWIVNGGDSGFDSIHNGLCELKNHCQYDDVIVIHDGNRCLVSQDVISNSLAVYAKEGSSVAVIPCTEVVFRKTDENAPLEEIPREQLYRTQTPHVFSFGSLWQAHREAEQRGIASSPATCSLMKVLGKSFSFSVGSEKNFKITTVDDIELFKAMINFTPIPGIKSR